MATINILVTNKHTVRSLLVTLYLIVIVIQISTTGNDGVIYTALVIGYLLCQQRIHAYERYLYT